MFTLIVHKIARYYIVSRKEVQKIFVQKVNYMKKLLTTTLAILTLLTLTNIPIHAEYEETEPETFEIAIPADQWSGTEETFVLDDGGIIEISISNIQDVPQPRATTTEELGIGTWTRSILYTYTNPNNNRTMRFGWTFKVNCSVTEYPKFTRLPYNFIYDNCTYNGPIIVKEQATTSYPAEMYGTALSSSAVMIGHCVEMYVRCDYHNMLRLSIIAG